MITLFKSKAADAKSKTADAMPFTGGDLQDVLLRLVRFGRPSLRKSSSHEGWHCYIEVNVAEVGASLEIKSEYAAPTPLAAALQCEERMLGAIKKIGGSQ